VILAANSARIFTHTENRRPAEVQRRGSHKKKGENMSRFRRAEARAREKLAKEAAKESRDTTIISRQRLTPIQKEERRQAEHAEAVAKEQRIARKDPEKAEAHKEKREAREQAAEEQKRFKRKPGRPTREEWEQWHGKKEESAKLPGVTEKKKKK
jgi:hypothetical protein